MRWWTGILAVSLVAAIIAIALAQEEKPQPSEADQKALKEAIGAWRKARDAWKEAQKSWEEIPKAVETNMKALDDCLKVGKELTKAREELDRLERSAADLPYDKLGRPPLSFRKAEAKAQKAVEDAEKKRKDAEKKREETWKEIMKTFDKALDTDRTAVELHTAAEQLENKLEGVSQDKELAEMKKDAEKEKSLTVPSLRSWLLSYGVEKNSIKFYATLKDRCIKVIGVVGEFGKRSGTGELYVSLGKGAASVFCRFPKEREKELESLSKGREILVVGTLRENMGGAIVLENCRIEENK